MNKRFRSKHIQVLWGRGFTLHVHVSAVWPTKRDWLLTVEADDPFVSHHPYINYHFRSKHIHVLWGRGFTVHVSAECGPQSETGYSQSKLTIHLPVNTPFRYFIVRGHTPSLLTAVTMCVTETQMNTRKPNKICMLTQCTKHKCYGERVS